MPDVVRALAISASILLLVVILTIGVSIVAVRRGEREMAGGHGHAAHDAPAVKDTAAAPAGKGAAVAAPDEINVMQVLILGTALFVISVVALLAVSILQHI